MPVSHRFHRQSIVLLGCPSHTLSEGRPHSVTHSLRIVSEPPEPFESREQELIHPMIEGRYSDFAELLGDQLGQTRKANEVIEA